MATVRITKTIAQHIVDCVMQDSKRTTSMESIYPKVREYLMSTIPVQVQEMMNDPILQKYLCWGSVYVGNVIVGMHGYLQGSGVIPDDLKLEITYLQAEVNRETQHRKDVAINLFNQIMACKNLTKLGEVLPEFNKYFKHLLVSDPVFPIQSKSVMDSLKEIGYKP